LSIVFDGKLRETKHNMAENGKNAGTSEDDKDIRAVRQD